MLLFSSLMCFCVALLSINTPPRNAELLFLHHAGIVSCLIGAAMLFIAWWETGL